MKRADEQKRTHVDKQQAVAGAGVNAGAAAPAPAAPAPACMIERNSRDVAWKAYHREARYSVPRAVFAAARRRNSATSASCGGGTDAIAVMAHRVGGKNAEKSNYDGMSMKLLPRPANLLGGMLLPRSVHLAVVP